MALQDLHSVTALSQPFVESASIQNVNEWVFLFAQNFLYKDG